MVSAGVVLTAAHCVTGRTPGSLTARLGEYDASSTTESHPHQDIGVSSILVHPNYYSPGVFYDLALLQLTSNADLNKPNIGLGCLPSIGTGTTTGGTFVVDQCVVAGWGKETFGDAGISAILKKIQVGRL